MAQQAASQVSQAVAQGNVPNPLPRLVLQRETSPMTLGAAGGEGPQDLVSRGGQRDAAGPQELRGRGRAPGRQLQQPGVKRSPKEQAVQGGGLQAEETGLAATEADQAGPKFRGGGGGAAGRVNQQRGEVQQAEGHGGAQAARGPRRRRLLLLLLRRDHGRRRQPDFKAHPVYEQLQREKPLGQRGRHRCCPGDAVSRRLEVHGSREKQGEPGACLVLSRDLLGRPPPPPRARLSCGNPGNFRCSLYVFAFQIGVNTVLMIIVRLRMEKKKQKTGVFFGLGHVLSLQVPCKFGVSSDLSEEYLK